MEIIRKLIGIFLVSMSLSILIIYFNLILYGFSLKEYIIYVLKTWEFYMIFPGLYLIIKR